LPVFRNIAAQAATATISFYHAYFQIANVVVPKPIESSFLHQEDKKFYEAAKHCGAYLVAGNLRHFPKEADVVSLADLLEIAKLAL
jgi:hypothetical protein